MAKKSSALKVSAKKAVSPSAKSGSIGSKSSVAKPAVRAIGKVKETAKQATKIKATLPPVAKSSGKAPVSKAVATKTTAKGIVSKSNAPKAIAPKVVVANEVVAVKAAATAKNAAVPVAKAAKEKESTKAQALSPMAKIDKANLTEDQVRWHEMLKKYGKEQAQIYSMSGQFNANSPLMHKTLGWGYVVSNDMDRLEVLFESGKKILISNYKPS